MQTTAFLQTAQWSWNRLLDLVYPPRCLVCESDGERVLCEWCVGSFAPIPAPICAVCGRPVTLTTGDEEANPLPCRNCEQAALVGDGWGFDAARAAGIYQGALREAIHKLKYNHEAAMGRPLGEFLAARCVEDALLTDLLPQSPNNIVVPLPIHQNRRRERGFNQSELLATPLADALRAPLLCDVVRKTAKTPRQVTLTGSERRKNVRAEMFAVADSTALRGKTVVLVDDVFTTGATVSACAWAIKADSGAAKIVVVALAAGG